jgi:hypothetical protein
MYQIPDIRLFWSTDTGFLSQFATDDPNEKIIYQVEQLASNYVITNVNSQSASVRNV